MWRVGQRLGSLSRRVGLWHHKKAPASSFHTQPPSAEQCLLPVLWKQTDVAALGGKLWSLHIVDMVPCPLAFAFCIP